MQQQDELFQLIKALTKSEKKFFTQYVNLYQKGAEPLYLQFFEFLNAEETYDEIKIFKKFRDDSFRKSYAATKHYLKNLIIKTLRHSDLTLRDDRDLSVFVLDVKRVMAKGLFPMAKKMIEKLKAEAVIEEKFYDVLHLIGMQRSLITLGYYKHEPEISLDILDEEEDLLLDKIKELRMLMNASIQLYSLMYYENEGQPDEVLKQIQSLATKKVLLDFNALKSSKAKHTFLQFWTQYFCATGDYKKYNELAIRKLNFVKTEKLPPGPSVNWRILAHNHCLSAQMLLNDSSGFEEHFRELEELQLQSSFHEAERFQTLSIFGLLHYLKNFDPVKLEYYLNYSKTGLKNLSPFIRRIFIYTLRTTIAYAYLRLKKLDECWNEVNELMTLTNGESRKDYVGHVKLINLLLRYEMKEYNYVSYLLKNTYRFFMNYLYTTPVHRFLISYLKEALKVKSQDGLTALNDNYRIILERLRYAPTEAEMALVMMAEDYLGKTKPKEQIAAVVNQDN